MKKIFLSIQFTVILLSIIMLHLGNVTQNISYALSNNPPLQIVAINDGDEVGFASLYGNGENYKTDVTLQVSFKNHDPYKINLEDGYFPYITVFDFGAEDKFLFYSSQTGGSGGYGNYSVYQLKTDSYKLLYNDKINSNDTTFTAIFIPNGFMQVHNISDSTSLDIYVGYMDKTFYDMIFAADGSTKEEQPYINDISFVSPALNSATGIWRLVTYRSVVAIAEINRLGYIVQTLEFDGKKFTAVFTEFSISL